MASYSAILRPLQHVRGVGEVGLAHDGPADVVRVQMSQHDSCDLVGSTPARSARWRAARAWEPMTMPARRLGRFRCRRASASRPQHEPRSTESAAATRRPRCGHWDRVRRRGATARRWPAGTRRGVGGSMARHRRQELSPWLRRGAGVGARATAGAGRSGRPAERSAGSQLRTKPRQLLRRFLRCRTGQ